MRKFGFNKEETTLDPFTDLLFNGLLGFAFMFAIAFMLIKPTPEEAKIDPDAEFIITVSWPDEHPDDIDTYVEDPQGNIVWYHIREAGLMHLDRDDRGNFKDTIVLDGEKIRNPLNQETITLRGIAKGEYVVNHTNRFMEVYDVDTNTVIEAEISTGNYNILQYCDQLTSLFANTTVPLVFTFNPEPTPPTTTNIVITSTKEFHVLNGTGFRRNESNFPDLGLGAIDVLSEFNTITGAWEIKGKRCDILGARYIDLDILQLSEWSANSFQPNNTLASIALDPASAVTNFEPSSTGPKRIFNPHAVISKISFAFYDNTPYKPRRPYNFNGLEHSMTLSFTVLSYEGNIPPLSNTI